MSFGGGGGFGGGDDADPYAGQLQRMVELGAAYESSDDEAYGMPNPFDEKKSSEETHGRMPLRLVLRVSDGGRVSGAKAVRLKARRHPCDDEEYLYHSISHLNTSFYAAHTPELSRRVKEADLGPNMLDDLSRELFDAGREGRDIPGIGRVLVLEPPPAVDLDAPPDAPPPAADAPPSTYQPAPGEVRELPNPGGPEVELTSKQLRGALRKLAPAPAPAPGAAPAPAAKRPKVQARPPGAGVEEVGGAPLLFASLAEEIARDHVAGYMPGEEPTEEERAAARERKRGALRAAGLDPSDAAWDSDPDADALPPLPPPPPPPPPPQPRPPSPAAGAAWRPSAWAVVRLEAEGNGVTAARLFHKAEAGRKGRLVLREVLRRVAATPGAFEDLVPAGSALRRRLAGRGAAVTDAELDEVFEMSRRGEVLDGVGRLVVRFAESWLM